MKDFRNITIVLCAFVTLVAVLVCTLNYVLYGSFYSDPDVALRAVHVLCVVWFATASVIIVDHFRYEGR